MTARPWTRSNYVAGAVGLLIGGFVIWQSWSYPMGSVRRMGPGYFPFLLGILITILSIGVVLFEGRGARNADIPRPAMRGLFWVALAIAAFALLLERFGMVPAVMAAVFLSARADDDLGWKETTLLALGTAAACTLIFVYILRLPLAAVEF